MEKYRLMTGMLDPKWSLDYIVYSALEKLSHNEVMNLPFLDVFLFSQFGKFESYLTEQMNGR